MKNEMKKILYLSIVDWNWIKQRPQMIAEQLSDNYIVYCIYPMYHKKKELANNDVCSNNLHLIPRFKLPFSGKNSFIKKIDTLCQHIFVALSIVKYQPDIIYTSFPTDYSFFLKKTKRMIVYDCMDNHPEFEKNNRAKKNIRNIENKLVNISSIIFVSSLFLKKEIIQKYNTSEDKVFLIRNGYSGEIIETNYSPQITRSKLKIAYIGTVSSWFDFNILINAIKVKPNLEFHIFGPINVETPVNNNLFFHGVVNHDELYKTVEHYDGLIMPFVLNEIIEAVDPVKLYEYINFNKPIISIYYEEIQRFEKFVWFYDDFSSFMDCINRIEQYDIKYNNEDRIKFLNDSNWKNRVCAIDSLLKKCINMKVQEHD